MAQVKIRGFRIELGEIEVTLERHPNVIEAAVIASDGGSDKQLNAYISVHQNASNHPKLFRDFLREYLPDYMIPFHFTLLRELPHTDAGKIDRESLSTLLVGVEDYNFVEAPIGLVEERLAMIWRELLEIPEVGRNNNFIELGGDSLLATHVSTLVRQTDSIVTGSNGFAEETLLGRVAHWRCGPFGKRRVLLVVGRDLQ